jgi:hypothetical protein
MKFFKSPLWPSALGLLCSLTSAHAHSVQEEPSQVTIAPRRDYLTLRISGAAIDWRDVMSKDPHHQGTSARQAPNQDQMAAEYARTHLVLEQGGQILPLKVQQLGWKKLRENDDSSERIEIFLRAARPEKLATQPLSVASDLFSNLEKASTIIDLGATSKVVRGAQTAEFPGVETIPTFGSDLKGFALSGALEPLQSLPRLFLLATLLLGASLLPLRFLPRFLSALIVGQSLTFLLDLLTPVAARSGTNLVLAACTLLLGGLCWRLARQGEDPWGTKLFAAFALLGGLASGFSGAAPLRLWGLPESGLLWCGLAFVAGGAVTQLLLTLMLWPLLSHWKGKFTQQAQYGGMDWPRAVQIAALACGVVGGFYGLMA